MNLLDPQCLFELFLPRNSSTERGRKILSKTCRPFPFRMFGLTMKFRFLRGTPFVVCSVSGFD
jgi:hypothetical protein